MARRRAPVPRGGPRPKALTNWARSIATAPVPVAVGAKVLITTVVLSNPGIDETVRRTRGMFEVTSNQSAAMALQYGAFGAVVVNDLAVAAGAASIPGSVTDASDDGWFLWVPFIQTTGVTEDGTGTASPGVNRYHFDSKAMRKIEEGFSVAFMVENASPDPFEFADAISLLASLR